MTFTRDTHIMARRSVLFGVTEDRQRLMRTLGAHDQRRTDEFNLHPSDRATARSAITAAGAGRKFLGARCARRCRHRLRSGHGYEQQSDDAQLLSVTLQCNKTRVSSMLFSDTISDLRREGRRQPITRSRMKSRSICSSATSASHSWFATQSIIVWREFLDAIANIREGDRTMLDNMVVLAHSACSDAKAHSEDGIPAMVAGNGNSAVRTGFHIAGNGDSIARVGLSLQQP